MGPIHSLADFLDVLRRRWLLVVAMTVLGALASLGFAASRNHVYQSWTVLQVAQPQISTDLAASTVAGSSARRLQLIEQRLMARSSILDLIREEGLFADLPGLSSQEKVDLFRAAVQIEGVAAAREGFTDDGTVSVVTITANMATPLQAQRVAQALAERTLDLSRASRIAKARETQDFFAAQEDSLRSRVVELEAGIAAFRNANSAALPGSIEFRREEIGTLNQGLLDIARERIALQRRAEQAAQTERPATAQRIRDDVTEALATLDAQARILAERKADLEASIETKPEIDRQLGAMERELERYRDELQQAAANHTAAEVGYRLEEEGRSERLTVIEQAPLPDYPVSGSRTKLALMGTLASLAAGILIAVGLEFRRPVLRTAAQMERELGILPVVSIPVLDTRAPGRGGWRGLFRRAARLRRRPEDTA